MISAVWVVATTANSVETMRPSGYFQCMANSLVKLPVWLILDFKAAIYIWEIQKSDDDIFDGDIT